MRAIHSRTEKLIGKHGLDKLRNSTVAVFGVGGVGSFAVEALARAGVGHIVIVDFDDVDASNINRQIHAFRDTVGLSKVDLMERRIQKIDDDIEITAICKKYLPDTAEQEFDFNWDYVIDAIDMVSSKIDLIERCYKLDIPIISSMGTGNKLYPEKFQIVDIYETHTCPLARVMRKELRARGVTSLNVCFSDEAPITNYVDNDSMNDEISTKKIMMDKISDNAESKRVKNVGSISFVPPVAGMLCAGKVIRDLISVSDNR